MIKRKNFQFVNTSLKFIIIFAILICLNSIVIGALVQDYDPLAHPSAIVISGKARFTVLTPRVLRMEWTEDGIFEDHASLTFINRKLLIPEFEKTENEGWLYIKTEKLILKYKIGSSSLCRIRTS